MDNDESLKIMLGNSIELPEMDYDDEEVESQTGYPVEEEALKEFYFSVVTSNMSLPDFKENYLTVLPHIIKLPLEDQTLLVNSILQLMPEKYNFEFSINLDPSNQDDINELYRFIEFVEYDHEKIICSVWKYLNLTESEMYNLPIENLCQKYINKIISEINEYADAHRYSEMIKDFLRTYNKEDFMEWFCEKSKVVKTSILIKLRKE
jgi:hypothetical protein